MAQYKIAVRTGDVRGAGTDANVFAQIFGENGDTGERKLEASGNNFERGHTDTFGIEAVSLGELTKFRIGHGMFLCMKTMRGEAEISYMLICNRRRWFRKWMVPR